MWEVIDNLTYSFLLFLIFYLSVKYYLLIKCKNNIKVFLFIIICSIISGYTGYLGIDMTMNIFISIFSYLMLRIFFKISISKGIFLVSLYGSIMAGIEISLYIILSKIFKIIIVNEDITRICLYFMIALIWMIIGYFNRDKIRNIGKIEVSQQIIFIMVLLFLSIKFLFLVIINNRNIGINDISLIVIILIMILVIGVLIHNEYYIKQVLFRYDLILDFIKKYEDEINKQRIMRHEVRNQLLAIKAKVIDNNSKEEIIDYINLVSKDNDYDILYGIYSKLNYLPANGIKGLFYYKIYEAINNGIDVDINISKDINNSFIDKIDEYTYNDFIKLCGILIDNAIDGAIISKDRQIGIEMYKQDKDISLIISNTYDNNKAKFIGTSKGIGHGYGLKLARNIVNDNKQFKLNTELNDKVCCQKLVIRKM